MFESILGNDKAKENFKNSIVANKITHSYMFLGKDGIGKRLFAKELAKQILCLDEHKNEKACYCNSCKSCIEFDGDNNPDFKIIEIEPEEKSIKIEQIRNMQTKIAEKTIVSERKVYIIDNADTMTREAQNCLLKTLEEPPEYVSIFLIGQNESEFLTTIKSRCTKINFEKVPNNLIKQYLSENTDIINIKDEILDLCDGSIKKALNYKENEEKMLSIKNIVDKIDCVDVLEILNYAESLYKAKDEIFDLLDNINILLIKRSRENPQIARGIHVIEETKKRLKSNSNYDMTIDNMIFNLWEEVVRK